MTISRTYRRLFAMIAVAIALCIQPNTVLADTQVENTSWQTTAPLPEPRYDGQSAAVLNNFLYFIGGRRVASEWTDTIYYTTPNVDGTLNSWQTNAVPTGAAPPYPRLVTNGERLYFFASGAGHRTVRFTKPNATDGSITGFTQTTSIPDSRQDYAVAMTNKYAYVLGGNGPVDYPTIYAKINADGSLGNWVETMQIPRVNLWAHRATSCHNRVYLFGGGYDEDKAHYAAINPDGSLGQWVESGNPMPQDKSDFGIAADCDNNLIYLVGGSSRRANVTSVYYATINPTDGSITSWTELASLPEAAAFQSSALHNGYLYAIGGVDSGGTRNEALFMQVGEPSGNLCDTAIGISTAECQVLEQLYQMTGGDQWANNSDWLQTNMPCNWYGVTCAGGYVSELNLQSNQLNGPLPSELSTLSNLTNLQLNANQLTGSLPTSLADLTNLQQFHYHETDLCEPEDAILQTWLNGLSDLQGTNTSCNTGGAGPTLSISISGTLSVGDLVYIPVYIHDITTDHDLRDIQFQLAVSDSGILEPASDQPIQLGDFFPATSFSNMFAMSNGWGFILTAPLDPAPAASGTGIIASFPFYVRSEGTVTFSFPDYQLTSGSNPNDKISVVPPSPSDDILAVPPLSTVSGQIYLQSRSSSDISGVEVILISSDTLSQTATLDASGFFTFTDMDEGTYRLHASRDLFVAAQRTITVEAGLSIPVEVGLWAGDVNGDNEVTAADWYILSAATYPVNHPGFDINGDSQTNGIDRIILVGNLDQENLPTTNPPKSASARVQNEEVFLEPQISENNSRLALTAQGQNEVLLRLTNVSETSYAVGTQLDLPDGATITDVVLQGVFAGGFLSWQQVENKLYIIATPPDGTNITQDSDVALIQMTGANTEAIEIVTENVITTEAPSSPETAIITIFLPVLPNHINQE